jgi:hypothetical protein
VYRSSLGTVSHTFVDLLGMGNCTVGCDVDLLGVGNCTDGCDVDLCGVGDWVVVIGSLWSA